MAVLIVDGGPQTGFGWGQTGLRGRSHDAKYAAAEITNIEVEI